MLLVSLLCPLSFPPVSLPFPSRFPLFTLPFPIVSLPFHCRFPPISLPFSFPFPSRFPLVFLSFPCRFLSFPSRFPHFLKFHSRFPLLSLSFPSRFHDVSFMLTLGFPLLSLSFPSRFLVLSLSFPIVFLHVSLISSNFIPVSLAFPTGFPLVSLLRRVRCRECPHFTVCYNRGNYSIKLEQVFSITLPNSILPAHIDHTLDHSVIAGLTKHSMRVFTDYFLKTKPKSSCFKDLKCST